MNQTDLSNKKFRLLNKHGISHRLIKKIKRRHKYMLNKFGNYTLMDEIYNLSYNEKNLICDILFYILIRHIELYGVKLKMINIDYLLFEVFKLFGIHLGIHVSTPFRLIYYKKYCKKIMNYVKNEFDIDCGESEESDEGSYDCDESDYEFQFDFN